MYIYIYILGHRYSIDSIHELLSHFAYLKLGPQHPLSFLCLPAQCGRSNWFKRRPVSNPAAKKCSRHAEFVFPRSHLRFRRIFKGDDSWIKKKYTKNLITEAMHVKSKDSRSLGPILTFRLSNHGSLAPKGDNQWVAGNDFATRDRPMGLNVDSDIGISEYPLFVIVLRLNRQQTKPRTRPLTGRILSKSRGWFRASKKKRHVNSSWVMSS